METRNWLGISTVLYVAAWPLAAVATFFWFGLVAGDHAPDRTAAQIAYDNQLHTQMGRIIYPCFFGAWLLVAVLGWWRCKLRTRWEKEKELWKRLRGLN